MSRGALIENGSHMLSYIKSSTASLVLIMTSCGLPQSGLTITRGAAPARSTPTKPSTPIPGNTNNCRDIAKVTSKLFVTYVVHNEEDDAHCKQSSAPEPDYNGNKNLFLVYSKTIVELAKLLNEFGMKLSFQPDWTFVEGVKKFQPDFFSHLLSVGNVEVLPHAHATCVSYPELFRRLHDLGANPQKIIGGVTWDDYKSQDENKSPAGWAQWGAPAASIGHKNDKKFPPVVYRMKSPQQLQKSGDEHIHNAASPNIVTPGFLVSPGQPLELGVWLNQKPPKHTLSPVYIFDAPKFVSDAKSAAEYINRVRQMIVSKVLPYKQNGSIEFVQVSELISLFKKYESCLDLEDGQSVLK